MSAPWQIVLAAMAVPILAVAVASCGNHCEKLHVRAATWGIVVPLGVVNPIAWLGALVIIARLHVRTTKQHAAGINAPLPQPLPASGRGELRSKEILIKNPYPPLSIAVRD